jgi:hypothetical protein
MKTILALSLIALLSGCSSTQIDHATIHSATFNSATWKSQAGVAGNATIEATTSPKTDTDVGL